MDKPLILVTGTTSGVGLNLLEQLLNSNQFYVACINRSELPHLLANHPRLIMNFIKDLSNPDSLTALEESLKRYSYDIVINNAGITKRDYLENHSFDEISSILNINLVSPILIHKFTQDDGKNQLFINVLSGSAVEEFRMLPVYATAKAGLLKFSKQLLKDYDDKGLDNKQIINLLPGPIDTKLCPDHYKNGNILSPYQVAKTIIEIIDKRSKYKSYEEILI